MEIRTYFQFIVRKWAIILAITIATLIGTWVLTSRTQRIYETSSTYILSVSPLTLDKDRISALNTLMSSPDISATYAKVANSRLISDLAARKLALSAAQQGDLSVDSHIIAGTNILEITVQGTDPGLIKDYANALGAQMVAYAGNLYQAYTLDPLDQATQPKSPVRPNLRTNMLFGIIFGLALGIGLAFILELAQPPAEAGTIFNILDESTGLYNKRYFLLRLHEEMRRVKRSKHPLSMALLELDNERELRDVASPARERAVKLVGSAVQQHLRDEEILAAYDETIIALLLPETGGSLAKTRVEILLNVINTTAVEIGTGSAALLQGNAGIVTYQLGKSGKELTPEELVEQAQNAMQPEARPVRRKARPSRSAVPQES